MIDFLTSARTRLLAFTDRIAFVAPLLIRITLGVVFMGTGWGKLHTLDTVTEFFTSLHIPLPGLNARIAASTEFFGGFLLLIGLGSRLVSLPLAFTMVVAILTAKRDDLDSVRSLLAFDEWAYLVMFLVIAIRGPGAASIDALLGRRTPSRHVSSDVIVPPMITPQKGVHREGV